MASEQSINFLSAFPRRDHPSTSTISSLSSPPTHFPSTSLPQTNEDVRTVTPTGCVGGLNMEASNKIVFASPHPSLGQQPWALNLSFDEPTPVHPLTSFDSQGGPRTPDFSFDGSQDCSFDEAVRTALSHYSPSSSSSSSSHPHAHSTSASPPSDHPSYVQTFRIPEPTCYPPTPPRSQSSLSSHLPLVPSPSLDSALSVLSQPSPWNHHSRRNTRLLAPAPIEPDPLNLYVTLEDAAEALKSPLPRRPRAATSIATASTVSGSPRHSPIERPVVSKRPKPRRSTTEPNSLTTSQDLADTSPKRRRSKRKPEGHIPRAPNAWILYRSARVKQLQEEGYETPKLQSDLSKLVASMWRSESTEARELYARRASVEAKVHAERHPGYSYKPAQPTQPRRKPGEKTKDVSGRGRSKTTSSTLEAHLSGFSINSAPQPSPFSSYAYSNGGDLPVGSSGSDTIEDYPFTPSTAASFCDSTLPSTPTSAASEAWTMFQSYDPVVFDYSTSDPSPYSTQSNLSSSSEPCQSAPAHLSTFPFSFAVPPPVFEPFEPSVMSPSTSLDDSSSTHSHDHRPLDLTLPQLPSSSSSSSSNYEPQPSYSAFFESCQMLPRDPDSIHIDDEHNGSSISPETTNDQWYLSPDQSQEYSSCQFTS